MKPKEWSWSKRRSAIEPIIGHTKADHRMDRHISREKTATKSTPSWPGAVST